MLQDLIELEDRFWPYLRPGDYTFIGPSDLRLLEGFIKIANRFAPRRGFFRSIHHVLPHQPATRGALDYLPPNTSLRIFVVYGTVRRHLIYASIEEYCKENNIAFQL